MRRDFKEELSALWQTAASNPMPALMLKSLTFPGSPEGSFSSLRLPETGLWVKESSMEARLW